MSSLIDDLNKKLSGNFAFTGKELYEKAEPLSTGLPALDWEIGIGGVPKGHITELYGKPSDGKSTLALTMIASAQKNGLRCVFVDAELTFNHDYAKALGVDIDTLTIIRAQFGEEYLDTVEVIVKGNMADLIVIDSLDAITPRAEIEAEMFQATMGVKARLMSRFCRRIIEPLKKNKIALVIINQTRVNIITGQEDTGGGTALKFYTSLRIKVKNITAIKEGEVVIGKKVLIKIVKNKVGSPFGEVEANLLFGRGFSAEADLLDIALKAGVLSKPKTTFYFGELKLGLGSAKARAFLEEHPEVLEEIKQKVSLGKLSTPIP